MLFIGNTTLLTFNVIDSAFLKNRNLQYNVFCISILLLNIVYEIDLCYYLQYYFVNSQCCILTHDLFLYSIIKGYLFCFQVGAFANSDGINILAYTFFANK